MPLQSEMTDDKFFMENYVYMGWGGELNCHVSHIDDVCVNLGGLVFRGCPNLERFGSQSIP